MQLEAQALHLAAHLQHLKRAWHESKEMEGAAVAHRAAAASEHHADEDAFRKIVAKSQQEAADQQDEHHAAMQLLQARLQSAEQAASDRQLRAENRQLVQELGTAHQDVAEAQDSRGALGTKLQAVEQKLNDAPLSCQSMKCRSGLPGRSLSEKLHPRQQRHVAQPCSSNKKVSVCSRQRSPTRPAPGSTEHASALQCGL